MNHEAGFFPVKGSVTFWKQNGMDKMPTPMILFVSVTVCTEFVSITFDDCHQLSTLL